MTIQTTNHTSTYKQMTIVWNKIYFTQLCIMGTFLNKHNAFISQIAGTYLINDYLK